MSKQGIISYAGQECPASLIVGSVIVDSVPDISLTTRDIPMSDGVQFIDKRYGTRKITAEIGLVSNSSNEVYTDFDAIAEWLEYKEPQPLILRDFPNRIFYAITDSAVTIDKLKNLGKATISFVCHDPHSYGADKSYPMSPDVTNVINEGNKETFPIINFTLKKNVTDFYITGSNQTIFLGETYDPTEKTVKDTTPTILNDAGSSLTNWTDASAFHVDGGTVLGTISSNGYSFQQSAKDYGTASGLWHGGAILRGLGTQLQDFDLEASIGFKASAMAQKGRVEVYLLDTNDKQIAKISLKDIDAKMENPMFDAWLGQINNGGVSTVNTYGDRRGVWRQFNGVINIGRRGKQWHFYCAQVDPTTYQHHTRYYKTVTDTWGRFGGKLAKVLVHIGAYGAEAPVDQMWVSNVRVDEVISKTTSEVSYAGKIGDTFTIDCEKGKILRNGKMFTQMQAGSQFLKLAKGANGIQFSDPTLLDQGTISFTERWI
jgi:predicted phage tail component-like protein